ncbi:nitroreductase family protein [Paenibacillus silvae]|uniref:Nitroreductase family protein n=1 Tax=Paenibacillus silvae TaxID=1325358 RepID=A0A2W6P087_9BACL|nr:MULTISPECIES: nitroreductase family protein [Paenibacillus]MCK6078900.1 nitroreductase family protein [Paenibacillus silvae]MCK6153219.1 nitroreductase family protein [Paenibacillus silvae]MCK6271425.1 nitroreductase family protein [Paenibacillus silvae]PZT53130.1 nitroreductase family protein [Paenibacillus silvae]
MHVQALLEKRRSVRHFDPDYALNEETLSTLIALASKSPNGNNIQATRYLVIDDPDLRNTLLPIAFNQQQVLEASALILMLGDFKAFAKNNITSILEEGFQAGFYDESTRDFLTDAAIQYYASKTEQELAIELTRDVSLAAMSFVLLAQEAGLQTITMSGYHSAELKSALNISDRYLDVMLIAVGKGIKEGHQTVRHPVEKIMYHNHIPA